MDPITKTRRYGGEWYYIQVPGKGLIKNEIGSTSGMGQFIEYTDDQTNALLYETIEKAVDVHQRHGIEIHIYRMFVKVIAENGPCKIVPTYKQEKE